MNNWLQRIWDFDFSGTGSSHTRIVFLFLSVVIIGFGYPVVEVLFGYGNASHDFNVIRYADTIRNGNTFTLYGKKLQDIFPHVWILLASFCVVMRFTIIIHSYFLSRAALGEPAFKRLFLRGIVSFIIGLGSSILIVLSLAGLGYVVGLRMEWSIKPVGDAIQYLSRLTDTYVPSVLKINHYWPALILIILLKDLPGYCIHWLTHKSRFFWLVTHRSHHVMDFLYPLATPPAFSFDFLTAIPSGITAIIISKLVYTEPMVMEMVLWQTAGYCFEAFNHSIIHYPVCYSNPVIRNFCRLFGGGGVYHLVHHSSYQQDQNVNFGGSPFMFWDRVFGTYRKPYQETPPVGLTHQPAVKWNPFRIIYGGIAQLIYEWKHNKNWRTRLCIIFGEVYYKPPFTKDFLVVDAK